MDSRVPRPSGASVPDRLYVEVALPFEEARSVAEHAVTVARRLAPKMTGASAARLYPLYGDGYIGIGWADDHVWYQEAGIRAFTMHRLAGKVVPMWLDDPTGELRRKNPKAKVRRTASGKMQVLVFRRAARHGQRRAVRRQDGTMTSVPASYPGAPGRISLREARLPYTTPGRVGGRIAAKNIGVRWRHPGLTPRSFILRALTKAAHTAGVAPGPAVASSGPLRTAA